MTDEPLSLSWKPGEREGTTIVELAGPLTLKNLFSFQQELANVSASVLILDLTASPYMDSAGLGALMRYYVSAERRSGKMLLVNANHRISALLETTKVDTVLQNYPSVAAAEASLS